MYGHGRLVAGWTGLDWTGLGGLGWMMDGGRDEGLDEWMRAGVRWQVGRLVQLAVRLGMTIITAARTLT